MFWSQNRTQNTELIPAIKASSESAASFIMQKQLASDIPQALAKNAAAISHWSSANSARLKIELMEQVGSEIIRTEINVGKISKKQRLQEQVSLQPSSFLSTVETRASSAGGKLTSISESNRKSFDRSRAISQCKCLNDS